MYSNKVCTEKNGEDVRYLSLLFCLDSLKYLFDYFGMEYLASMKRYNNSFVCLAVNSMTPLAPQHFKTSF